MTTVRPAKEKGKKKLMSILIEVKANGWEVTEQYEPAKNKDGFVMYDGPRVKDSKVFTEDGEALSYIEKCMGEREHSAHEKAEMRY